MKHIVTLISCLAAIMSFSMPLNARETASDTVVSFVTVYPGSEIYELEGHSALRVQMPSGEDIAVNYGLFNFNAPNFVYRFVKGETDYMVGAYPWTYFLDSYKGSGRRIVQRTLDLTPEQTRRLVKYLSENLRPENRVYRYNYVLDNCATRPLRAVELAVGDSIILPPSYLEADSYTPLTFRNVMRHFHRNYPWYQFGIDLALGPGIDRPISRREMSFAPAILDAQLGQARVGDRTLVRDTQVIVDTPADGATEGPTPWYLTPMAVFSLLLAIAIVLSVADIRRRKVCRLFDSVFFGAIGLAGLLLTFLIFISTHEATSPNWLYVWINPFCLIVPTLIWLKKGKTVIFRYQIVNFALLLLLCVSWPFLPQSANPAFLPLIATELIRSGSCIYIYHHMLRTACK